MADGGISGSLSHVVARKWQSSERLTKDMLVLPLFLYNNKEMKSQSKWKALRRIHVDEIIGEIKPMISKGLRSVLLFGVVSDSEKDEKGSLADSDNGPVAQAIKILKKNFPNLFIICDVCVCEYTSHGHCGIVSQDFKKKLQRGKSPIDLKKSVSRISEIALTYAKIGADSIAPSDMMDGRIGHIKLDLQKNGFLNNVFLMSYSAKFSSSLYEPFRDIACSSPSFGSRENYQFPHSARRYAERSISKDVNEGSDCIIVKPALFYLDIVRAAAIGFSQYLPICIYQVSGEYAILKHAAEAGIIDLKKIVFESHESFLRAGASIIISYFTPELLEWLEN